MIDWVKNMDISINLDHTKLLVVPLWVGHACNVKNVITHRFIFNSWVLFNIKKKFFFSSFFGHKFGMLYMIKMWNINYVLWNM